MKPTNPVFACLTAVMVIAISSAATITLSAKSLNAMAPAANPAQQKKSPPASKVVPAPDDWLTMIDKKKGYLFQVPKGTEFITDKSNGVDVFIGVTPEPAVVGIMVMAFKDPKMTKSDLLNFATGGLEGLGATKIKISGLIELSADYSLGTYTALNKDGGPIRGKILVATDVTDNYVMAVGTEESQYKANEKIIDEIWGSFSMQSGGASGKS
ncbi:MAG TPA: hypothetical protein VFZ34_09135 [Blastocatellia bacterium]|nr:hypothetical protein [Blastocatellia bacterium]